MPPVPFAKRATVKQELERLLKAGILPPIETGQWAAPIVVVKKSLGGIVICGDFKITINPQLEIDRQASYASGKINFSYAAGRCSVH